MDDILQLDKYFKKWINNISQLLPEGVINIDLKFLQKYKLLDFYNKNIANPALTRYFHVIESSEKITLVNDRFIVWIVPEKINNVNFTYTLIALNNEEKPKLEVAFIASGCYNGSRLVLRILENLLYEIQETEDFLEKISKNN